ncbi:energy transducer TonB [Rhodanobacter glycinis]|uniref:Energy transducer TonB n=1 Tax=Rhodanobacter glycinis TaxID=582702 RepID=A0A502C7Y6_9GAMM|nr:energy transducer TonB [Rhodanobacter glycinis]TPG09695.1 energy transducer TonB [Rhodanobacter glycinis]
MLRLRTTTGLSVLALAIGIAGTGWLSTLTVGWRGPTPRLASAQQGSSARRHALPSPRHRQGPVSVVRVHRAKADRAASDMGEAQAAVLAPASELVPLAMPGDTSQSWDELRGHLDGRVVLHVGIDGNGRVGAASLVESSGDPILDEHALRSVRGWRFAVPAEHPDGFGGDLPMRFSSHGDGIARVP